MCSTVTLFVKNVFVNSRNSNDDDFVCMPQNPCSLLFFLVAAKGRTGQQDSLKKVAIALFTTGKLDSEVKCVVLGSGHTEGVAHADGAAVQCMDGFKLFSLYSHTLQAMQNAVWAPHLFKGSLSFLQHGTPLDGKVNGLVLLLNMFKGLYSKGLCL